MPEPLIIPRTEHNISRSLISEEALRVLYRLKSQGFHAYLCGGSVRDMLLGRRPKDFDVATSATPKQMRHVFRNCRLIGRRFQLAHVFFGNKIIEVATFRSNAAPPPQPPEGELTRDGAGLPQEQARQEPEQVSAAEQQHGADAQDPRHGPHDNRGRHGHERGHRTQIKRADGLILRDNVFGTPEEDALRRDFTVNALFYNIDGFTVIDYVGGLEDLRRRLIRCIGDPRVRYTEDPVRMIRAIRFAATLGFNIEEQTAAAIPELKDWLTHASNARLYEEVLKLLQCGAAAPAYALLSRTGIWGVLFPQLDAWIKSGAQPGASDRIASACARIDEWTAARMDVDPALMFALLFGQYHEHLADETRQRGVPPSEALHQATMRHLSELSERVVVPRKVGYGMTHIIGSRHRFDRTRGNHPGRFAAHRGFRDALEYFRFVSQVTGEDRQLVQWWEQFGRTSHATAGRGRST